MKVGTLAALLVVLHLLPSGLAAQAQPEQLRLLGEVRVRGEADRPAGLDTTDAFTLLRSRIGVHVSLSPSSLVLLQLQDSRTFGEEESTVDGRANRLDLHQGWLQYGSTVGAWAWAARVGRQEVALGNERLIGAVGWSNTGRSFDAARLTFGKDNRSRAAGAVGTGPATVGGWTLTTLAANVQERGRRLTGAPAEDGDHVLLGAFVSAGAAEGYLFHDIAARYRQFSGVDRTTAGARLSSPALRGWTASAEGVWQFGNQLWEGAAGPEPQDIRAYLLGARLALETSLRAVPTLGIGVDLLSGDDEPGDGTYRAFNTMYATNHKFYGYIDLFLDPAARTRDQGLVDALASATVALPRQQSLAVDVHAFWLQQQLAPADDRLIGMELDLTIPVRLGPGQHLQLGYSAFRNGPAASLIGLGSDRETWHWAYIQATFSFGGPVAPAL